jgi:hypothetical protein
MYFVTRPVIVALIVGFVAFACYELWNLVPG